jgi:glyoxylase-like metal-dependent hydrolase (beta-lactamase superfamily II)
MSNTLSATARLVGGSVAMLVATTASAQQRSETTVTAAARAQGIVAAALDAMGGLEALQAIADITRQMSGIRTDAGQGSHPVAAGVLDPPAINHPVVTSVIDVRGQRTLNILRDTIFGGQPLARRTVAGPTGGYFANDLARTTSPMSQQGAANIRLGTARRFPELLLVQAWNRRDQLRAIGEATVRGRKQHVVTYADPTGVQVALYFDGATKLPTKFETVGDDPIIGDAAFEIYFDDWRQVGRVRVPHRYAERTNGVLLQELRASSIVLDSRPADSLFAVPNGYEPSPPNAPPAPKRLADDVFLLPGGYNALAVIFAEYVLVVEAGGNTNATQAAIAEIAKLAPGKPVRYVVSTHFHFDHLGGVRSYIAEGATVVTTPDAKEVIGHAAQSPRVLRPDALARKPRTAAIEVMTSKKRVFTDGTRTVELHDIGPNPHAAQMIVAYLPKERILYQADMLDLDVPEGRVGSPSVGEDTRALASAIERLGLIVETIVPSHGRLGTMDDLRRTVAKQ